MGTSRLRGCIVKANVNYNLEGDEEPGVFGRAQNLRFTLFWAWCQIPGLHLPCSKTQVFTRFSPHWHPQKHLKKSILTTFGPTMAARPQLGVKLASNLVPCKPCLEADVPTEGHHEPTMSNENPLPHHKVPRIVSPKAKKAPRCQ